MANPLYFCWCGSKTRGLENCDDNAIYYEKGDSYDFAWIEIKGDKTVAEVCQVVSDDDAPGFGSLATPQLVFRRLMSL